jgi:hypothetical protein
MFEKSSLGLHSDIAILQRVADARITEYLDQFNYDDHKEDDTDDDK